MKPFTLLALALCCAAPAAAAMSPSAQLKPWLGTWTCGKATQTFTPIFNGTGMRISENGKMASEDIIVWDAKHQKWIDENADASGNFSTSQGTSHGRSVTFTQVYPASDAVLTVTNYGNRYTSSFSGTVNGKHITQHATCTKS